MTRLGKLLEWSICSDSNVVSLAFSLDTQEGRALFKDKDALNVLEHKSLALVDKKERD